MAVDGHCQLSVLMTSIMTSKLRLYAGHSSRTYSNAGLSSCLADVLLLWLLCVGAWEKCREPHDCRQPGRHLWSKPHVVKESSVSGLTGLYQCMHTAVDYTLWWSLCQVVQSDLQLHLVLSFLLFQVCTAVCAKCVTQYLLHNECMKHLNVEHSCYVKFK